MTLVQSEILAEALKRGLVPARVAAEAVTRPVDMTSLEHVIERALAMGAYAPPA